MKVELEIVKDTFTNREGEVIEYFRCEAVVSGEVIRFAPHQDDKKLFKHLVNAAMKEVK